MRSAIANPRTNLIVRGFMRTSNGEYRYYLQIEDSDNSLVVNHSDIEIPPDEIALRTSDRNIYIVKCCGVSPNHICQHLLFEI